MTGNDRLVFCREKEEEQMRTIIGLSILFLFIYIHYLESLGIPADKIIKGIDFCATGVQQTK